MIADQHLGRAMRALCTYLPAALLRIVGAFYAYGALVHVLNIAGVNGFNWLASPLKWQILDLVYLVADLVVAWAFLRLRPIGFPVFYAAALSQILLYTLGRAWILDVPPAFAPDAEQIAYLNGLVAFHIITLLAVAAVQLQSRSRRPHLTAEAHR